MFVFIFLKLCPNHPLHYLVEAALKHYLFSILANPSNSLLGFEGQNVLQVVQTEICEEKACWHSLLVFDVF